MKVEITRRRRCAAAVPPASAVAPVSAVSPALGVLTLSPNAPRYAVRRRPPRPLLWYHRRARRSGRFYAYAEHQATEEACPRRGRGAAGEPSLPLDDQDADEAPRDDGRGRRRVGCRLCAPRARAADRSRGDAWRAASERGRAQEVAGLAARAAPLVAPRRISRARRAG